MTTMQTYTGRSWNLLRPRAEDVCLDDIAHQLARQTRYNGAHRPELVSVAEHCVMVSRYLEATGEDVVLQLAGLLHDAHEAYLGDVITPVMQALSARLGPALQEAWCVMAGHHDNVIVRWALPDDPCLRGALFGAMACAEVHHADQVLLATEKSQLLLGSAAPWPDLPPTWTRPDGSDVVLKCWPANLAAARFKARFKALRAEVTSP